MYAKLSSTITRSSIWREPPPTRCVWITLLALANKDGFVKGVEGWLSSEANVGRDECREALRTFMEPDPESQDQDYGGRRLEKVEGGWLVLNYAKYRGLRTHEQVLASERQQRKRLRDKEMDDSGDGGGEDVTRRHAASRSVTAIASASASASERSAVPRARDDLPDVADSPDGPAGADPDDPSPEALALLGTVLEPEALALLGTVLEPEAPVDPPPAGPLDGVFLHEAHRDAYRALRHKHRAPQTFDAALRSVHSPPGGGDAFAWDVIGAALLELAGNGEAFNVSRLRGYCRSLRTGAPARRRSDGHAATAAVDVGGQWLEASVLWQLCVDGGLTAPMQTRDMLEARVQALHARQLIDDNAAFLALVLHLQPWALAEIKFGKAREERLILAMASWRPAHQGAA